MNYFSVVYDIQRPPQDKKKANWIKIRMWNRLISDFVRDLEDIGIRINRSVFVIPARHYDFAKALIELYTKKFNELNIKNDIYILEYAPSSNEILKHKIRLQLKLQFDELKRKWNETKDANKRRAIKEQVELLRRLADAFGEPDLADQFVLENKTLSEVVK